MSGMKYTSQINMLVPPTEDNHLVRMTELGEALSKLTNNAGQVKVKYSGLSAIGFTAGSSVTLSVRNATATVLDSPLTKWPYQSISEVSNIYDLGFFIQGETEDGDRLRENNVLGQVHKWRVAGNYSDKDISNMGTLRCMLKNPDTGFKVSDNELLPSGSTGDDFTFEFTSISDNDSLAVGRGYQLMFQTSFDDANLAVTVNSILRISEAIDAGGV